MFDVCLVVMPFAAVERPSIAAGLLQSILDKAGIRATSLYANILYAEELGISQYAFWERALGDLTFSQSAFPDFQPNLDDHFRLASNRLRSEASRAGIEATGDDFIRLAQAVQTAADAFIERTARTVIDTGARIVGCTSMYWQHTASLALLRKVKDFDPSIVTMLGGANCEGVMGLANHRNFSWVDYVVSGEADDFIAPLCQTILVNGRNPSPAELPFGVFAPAHRRLGYPLSDKGDRVPRAACKNISVLPPPNYDNYFQTLRSSSMTGSVRSGLLVETARGCWYGAMHQCKFCGISEIGMAYHSKGADRVIRELQHLEERYQVSDFEVTDNILDMTYFKTVIPQLAGQPSSRRIFWETKANIKRSHVEMLAQAGVTWIQPGIESLDTRALKLMDKGVQASQNILLLKWCREFGVRLSWNFLWGFPAEEDEWYAEMAQRLFLLEHLQPPRLILRLRYDRYSVYQARADEYGLKLKPLPFMFLTYPVSEKEMTDLTYYFGADEEDGSRRDPIEKRPGVIALYRAVYRWQRKFWRSLAPILSFTDDGQSVKVLDSRTCAVEAQTRLAGLDRAVFLACDEGPGRPQLPALLEKNFGILAGTDEIDRALMNLRQRNLICEIDDRLVMLAVRGSIPKLPTLSEFPGGYTRPVIHRNGSASKEAQTISN
jgi:ribosomal peptide maturation radical SAM protein 1